MIKKTKPGTSFILFLLLVSLASWNKESKPERDFYQLTVYKYSTAEQEKVLDNYLEKALLPAYHRMGIKQVGVFKNMANDTVAVKLL
jgi:hypothetical protein